MSENNLVTPEVWLNDQHCGFYQSHGHCEEIPHHSENDRGELSHDDIQVVPRTSGQHEVKFVRLGRVSFILTLE